jgi:hypothetical protein
MIKMITSVHDWFFMRDGFDSFRLTPDRHRELLFGKFDRDQRDHLLNRIEEACYSLEGHKSVIYQDFGRGKTHQCKNVMWEIRRKQLPVFPVYVKCTEYKSKEPFPSFFKELILSIPTEHVQAMSEEYARKRRHGALSLREITGSEDVALVFEKGLAAPNLELVRQCMRYLGGEDKIGMDAVSSALPARLNISKEFGAAMKGLVHLFREVGAELDGTKCTVPLFFIDEAERFGQVSSPDTYWTWVAALRELTEINGSGMIFFVGAKSQDGIPEMLLIDEVRTRIGVINYVEFWNPDRDALMDFVLELCSTLLKKGQVPKDHVEALTDLGADLTTTIPQQMQDAVSGAGEELSTYPFSRTALDEFVESCAQAELSNKPREVLIRLQRAATKAIRKGEHLIAQSTVEEIIKESGV